MSLNLILPVQGFRSKETGLKMAERLISMLMENFIVQLILTIILLISNILPVSGMYSTYSRVIIKSDLL